MIEISGICDPNRVKITWAKLVASAVSERARERRESLGKEWMRPNTDLTLFKEKKERYIMLDEDKNSRKRMLFTNLWSTNVSAGYGMLASSFDS